MSQRDNMAFDDNHGETTFEGKGTLSDEVVRIVAVHADVPPERLPPLFEAVDPDALNAIFQPLPYGPRIGGAVTFPFAGHHVTVTADGTVEVEPVEEDA